MHREKNKGSAAKQTAWRNFSNNIRLRDCLKTTGSEFYCKCITCGHIEHYSFIQAGHAIAGRKNAVLFDEEIVNGQCTRCNVDHGGEYEAYKKVLVERHGQEWYDKKAAKKNGVTLMTDDQYRIISRYFLGKLKELKKEYGI